MQRDAAQIIDIISRMRPPLADLRKHQKLKHEVGEDQEMGSVIFLYLSGRSISSTAA